MSYVEQRGIKNNKTAVVGVAVIHALIGTVLISSLAPDLVEVFDPPPPPTTFNVPPDTPPPPPDPTTKVDNTIPTAPDVYTPISTIDLNTYDPAFDTNIELPDFSDTIIKNVPLTGDTTTVEPTPTPHPSFDPIAAKPRNDPGRWVTTRDYKRIWITREMTGTGRFEFSIGTNGQVTDCRVVSSTGHGALDQATCRLVSRRARFDAARDSNGNLTPGNFTTSIRWELPD